MLDMGGAKLLAAVILCARRLFVKVFRVRSPFTGMKILSEGIDRH